MAQEKIMPLKDSLELHPYFLEAVVKVCNARNKEKQQEADDAKKNISKNPTKQKTPANEQAVDVGAYDETIYPEGHPSNKSSSRKSELGVAPPVVNDPRSKEKLNKKLEEFKTWSKEVNFDEIYKNAKQIESKHKGDDWGD